ncbi:MAG TPA: TonB-dependent receptor plug domain-containing protein [Opitutaceae bacterium]|nr:TonB-dependent receptor plug domain-containing protein [Opitutaceae bacterium]
MQTHRNVTGASHLAWMAAASLLLFSSGYAQSPAPETAAEKAAREKAAREGASETPVVLSPFVVDSSKDQGYRATSTLAGSRINTDLRDIAASITVLTKEFLIDVAAVDVNDVLAYTANAEGTRDFTSSTSSLGRPTDDVAASPNTANRIRGLARAEVTRDYFYTIGTGVGFDTYNLDQVTINRGPNSLLAGLGSPAGIINYSPQLAGLSKNRTEVSLRFGSYEDKRATLNTNLVAKKDVLAFRVAAAWSDRGFKQQPAWNEDQRVYLTGTFRPWRKTTIRASYENAKIDSSNPNSITPEDAVTQWIALGKPIYDSASTAPVSPFLTRNGTNMPTVMFNKSGAIERAFNTNTGYDFYQQNLSNVGIFTPQRMFDNRFFQLDEVNLSPSLQDMSFDARSISVDQEILPGLNANVSYVRETVDNEFLNLFRTEYAVYNIDVNKNLPDGTANPHFLETFMQFRGLDNKQVDHNTNEVGRGTLTYDLDLTQRNKWLGRYRVTGFVEKRKTETERWQYNAKVAGNLNPESVGYRYYLGGSDTRPATSMPLHPGLVAAVPEMIVGTGGAVSTGALTSFYGLKSDQRQLVELGTSAAVFQGYLWGDRIIGMYGVRKDKNEAAFQTAAGGSGGIVPPAPLGYPPANVFEQRTKTYGVVVRPLKWLSLHYNEAENFIPNAGAVDLLGAPTPAPKGTGKDYGVSVSLFENALNVKLNWFELTSANGAAGNANFPIAQWTMPYMELTFMPDLARQAGITYKPLMAGGLITGDPRLANAYTSDNVSEGLELEATYNVTKNWRIMASVSKQEAKQTNIASALTSFIENRLAYWQSIPALWTGFTAQNVGWGVGRTGQQQWDSDNNPYYIGYKSVDGKPSPQLAKWRASAVTNYTFNTDGPLKGFSVGAGARYIEKSIIGNPAIRNAAGVVVGLDLDHPFYNQTNIAIDAWVGYRRKILGGKYDLSFQLNGRDLEQGGGLRPIVANSDGGHPVYRIVQPRTFYLTTTLGF